MLDALRKRWSAWFGGRRRPEQLLAPPAFTAAFVQALTRSAPSLQVTVDTDLRLSLRDPKGEQMVAFLDNAYAAYCQHPEALDEVLRIYMRSYSEMGATTKPVDPSRIVPVVKDRPWLEEILAQARNQSVDAPVAYVHEPLNEHLMVIYAEDSPSNIRYFTEADFAALDIPRTSLRSLATANLRRLISQPRVEAGPEVSMITVGGDYEASVLLLDEVWDNLCYQHGELVLAVPARDLLLFTQSSNAPGIKRLRELAARFAHESPYRLTARLFIRRPSGLETYSDT